MEKMRAMVLSKCAPIESNPLKLSEIDRHQIEKPDEILIKIEACGVCHSQLHGIEGDWKDLGIPPTLPTVPGHEVVGSVVEIGTDVTKFKVGDRAGLSKNGFKKVLDITLANKSREDLFADIRRLEKAVEIVV